MKPNSLKRSLVVLAAGLLLLNASAEAAAPNPSLAKVKQEAESKGYIFESSHDEIVAKARKEGKLRVLSTMESAVIKAMREAFKKKYPFIDLQVQELGSVEENQRFLLELKAGMVKSWDVNRA
jgi:ABC-type glycerol-3-phosphate transport system substrate-binding protein